ncbi:MAG: methyl-accepting chemotaxis protein [Xanthobacteraceae bacterium]|nr:methyl-accepting chemotaxis protein [Xanthobacteraceae bacterium]MBX3547698.1 methyl-accepting chemotaxis protein [Xanthobacteraceae bacterium]
MAQAWRQTDGGRELAGGSNDAAAGHEAVTRVEHGEDTLHRVRESLDLLESDLGVLILKVGDAAKSVHEGIGSSARSLEAITGSAANLSEQVGIAETNVNAFATATEQLAQSSTLISTQIHKANDLAAEASEAASTTGKQVERLQASSADIGKVVTFISTIAKQTHLLALNASIEAARAGDAGRGFAVVANEVKALSAETQQAISEITSKIDALRKDADESMAMLGRIANVIEEIRPLFATVSSSVEQQVATTAELSVNASDNSNFIGTVARSVEKIRGAAESARTEGAQIDASAHTASDLAATLRKRLSIFLRATEIGDRRQFDRLPCDWSVTVTAAGMKSDAVTVDVGDGGVLLKPSDTWNLRVGENIHIDIPGAGNIAARVVNRTELGIHCAFFDVAPDSAASLKRKLDKIRDDNKDFIDLAITTADKIGGAIERLIHSGKVTAEMMFDNHYEPIPGTNPVQYDKPYLAALEQELWPIQEPLLAADQRMVFCGAVDRNAYLPVHNKKYSLAQRPGEIEWNTANARNKRIFDDRAGLSAARNTRPYMIQYYPRDMGGGHIFMMWEIVAPIRVLGRHWGAFRAGYRI